MFNCGYFFITINFTAKAHTKVDSSAFRC